jgi:hypothetical protein
MRRALLLATTMAISALMAVGIAFADPVNAPSAGTLDFVCGGEEVTEVHA